MMEKHAREYLDQIPLWTRKKNTLDQVRDFLDKLGDPEEGRKIIHVAGTNGKGSVCADLTAILTEAGYTVGTFISPHLTDVKERFLFNGQPVSEEVFEAGFARVRAITDEMMQSGYAHPTFFEFVFYMAMSIYQRLQPDYLILETGLGGRLDTTNVIRRPQACIITSISLDHTRYLGDSIEKIAGEKAGIIKEGVPVIYDDTSPTASAVTRQQAALLKAPACPCGEADSCREVMFAAPYQSRNAALAVKTLSVLAVPGVTDSVIRKALSQVRWEGRMQQVREDIWLDGAHNVGGIEAFIQAVKAQKNHKRLQLLFAAVSDKDYQEMIRLLCKELPISRVTVVHLQSERGLDAETLAEQFQANGCQTVSQYDTAAAALKAALAAKTEEDRLYIVGSLYLIGEILKIIRTLPVTE